MSRNGSSRKIVNPLVDPHLLIVEQPSSNPIRFRYECEGRSAGSIPGARSTTENRTFPTIKIMNWTGSAVVVISCVSHTKPHRPHPNLLVGRDGCKDGISTMTFNVTPDKNVFEYQNMGIQCVKKNDVAASLCKREDKNVDPFKTGFDHKCQKIQLNAVRLCFQVFLRKTCPKGGFKNIPLPPLVSDPIFDKKSKNDLVIVDISEPVGTADGGTKMMIFCEKLLKEDIAVRFFERRNDEVVWSALADLKPQNVHRQVAMSFRTPPYRKTGSLEHPVQVMIELFRPSDGATSLPTSFVYLPVSYDISKPQSMKRKRPNVAQNKPLHDFLGANPPTKHVMEAIKSANTNYFGASANTLNIPVNPQQISCQPQVSPELNHLQPHTIHNVPSISPTNLNNGNSESPPSMVHDMNMNNLNQCINPIQQIKPNNYESLMKHSNGSPPVINNNNSSPSDNHLSPHNYNDLQCNIIQIPESNGFQCQPHQQQANYANWNQLQPTVNQDCFYQDQFVVVPPTGPCNTNNFNNQVQPQPHDQFQPFMQMPPQQTHYPNNNNIQADQPYYMYPTEDASTGQTLQPLLTPREHRQQLQQQLDQFQNVFDDALISGTPQPPLGHTKCDLPQLTLTSHEFPSTVGGQYNAYAANGNDGLKVVEEDEGDLENMTDSFSSLSVTK